MNTHITSIEPLLERVEEYGKTRFKLLRLKSIDKAADVSSTLFSRLVFTVIILIFMMTLNIAIALWLGDLLGKNYYGFLIVTAFYGIVGIVVGLIHPFFKSHINNSIVKQMLTH
jgi:hypothetical protein